MAVIVWSMLYLTVLLFSLGNAALTDSPPGDSCSAGVTGSPGHNGQPGRDGRDGKDGRDGATGPKGDRGEPGDPVPGPPGKMGPAGPPGPRGERGDMGVPGSLLAYNVFFLAEHDMDNMMLRISLVEKAASFRIFRKVGGKYYATEGLQSSFDTGLKFCRDAGGDLVLPQNEKENDVLASMLAQVGGSHGWLGTTDRKTEGTFLDTKGNPLNFTKWGEGEPNNHGNGEDCGLIFQNSGGWNDGGCDSNFHIVCELNN
ncbi:mannose-binding protein C-like [Engraulis encrasicolus]|uniref:mannose-binding protein C-like n=1 Tax=Engraulis encrasicolus TaxID=184585 RepID=UPI002FD2D88D